MANLSTILAISMAPLLLLVHMTTQTSGSNIGVCYRMGDKLPPPSEVVALYKSYNIGLMRLYAPHQAVLEALGGSNIQLILDVPNEDIESLATDPVVAGNWVEDNILAYPNVAFRYIIIGNDVFPDNSRTQFVLPAIKNIQTALFFSGLENKIKASTAVSQSVLGTSYPPSAGKFSSAASLFLGPIIHFLKAQGAPLLANVYPYSTYNDNKNEVDINYALFTSPGIVVQDGQLGYQNLFDATVDAFYSALEMVGGANVSVIVSESGWPSGGGEPAATVANAYTYNSNLIKHVNQGTGTPKRPTDPIETYIFSMFNDDLKHPPGIEHNYGLFFPNQKPVYPVTFD